MVEALSHTNTRSVHGRRLSLTQLQTVNEAEERLCTSTVELL